jgi:hypothetical protein
MKVMMLLMMIDAKALKIRAVVVMDAFSDFPL